MGRIEWAHLNDMVHVVRDVLVHDLALVDDLRVLRTLRDLIFLRVEPSENLLVLLRVHLETQHNI